MSQVHLTAVEVQQLAPYWNALASLFAQRDANLNIELNAVVEAAKSEAIAETDPRIADLTTRLATVETVSNANAKEVADAVSMLAEIDFNGDKSLQEVIEDLAQGREAYTLSKANQNAINALNSGLNTTNTNVSNLQTVQGQIVAKCNDNEGKIASMQPEVAKIPSIIAKDVEQDQRITDLENQVHPEPDLTPYATKVELNAAKSDAYARDMEIVDVLAKGLIDMAANVQAYKFQRVQAPVAMASEAAPEVVEVLEANAAMV